MGIPRSVCLWFVLSIGEYNKKMALVQGNGVKGVFVCSSSSPQYQPTNEACDAAEAQKQYSNNKKKKTQWVKKAAGYNSKFTIYYYEIKSTSGKDLRYFYRLKKRPRLSNNIIILKYI